MPNTEQTLSRHFYQYNNMGGGTKNASWTYTTREMTNYNILITFWTYIVYPPYHSQLYIFHNFLSWSPWSQDSSKLVLIYQLKATYPECHVLIKISRLMIRVRWDDTWGCAQISWHLPYGWGKSGENSARTPSDEDYATSHRLRWRPLPPNDKLLS